VKRILVGLRPDFLGVTSWFTPNFGNTRRRPETTVDSGIGDVSRKRPSITPAAELSKFHQDLMEQEPAYGLAVVGKQTEMQTVHVSRTVGRDLRRRANIVVFL